MSNNWFVVQTQPRGEGRAKLNLVRQGFDVYLPEYEKRRRHARRVEIVKTALFPRYIFIAEDSARGKWRTIHSTFGVSRLLMHGEQPALVGGVIVEDLQRRERNGVLSLPARRQLKCGDRVRILEGAFEDCYGLFEEMRDEERVCVLLDLLGRKVRVVLDELLVAAG